MEFMLEMATQTLTNLLLYIKKENNTFYNYY